MLLFFLIICKKAETSVSYAFILNQLSGLNERAVDLTEATIQVGLIVFAISEASARTPDSTDATALYTLVQFWLVEAKNLQQHKQKKINNKTKVNAAAFKKINLIHSFFSIASNIVLLKNVQVSPILCK